MLAPPVAVNASLDSISEIGGSAEYGGGGLGSGATVGVGAVIGEDTASTCGTTSVTGGGGGFENGNILKLGWGFCGAMRGTGEPMKKLGPGGRGHIFLAAGSCAGMDGARGGELMTE